MFFIVKRKLKDYEAWKKVVGDNELRKARGSKGMTSYRSAKDPNEVYMVFEWDADKPYIDYSKSSRSAKGFGGHRHHRGPRDQRDFPPGWVGVDI